jgi:hypothetical protein
MRGLFVSILAGQTPLTLQALTWGAFRAKALPSARSPSRPAQLRASPCPVAAAQCTSLGAHASFERCRGAGWRWEISAHETLCAGQRLLLCWHVHSLHAPPSPASPLHLRRLQAYSKYLTQWLPACAFSAFTHGLPYSHFSRSFRWQVTNTLMGLVVNCVMPIPTMQVMKDGLGELGLSQGELHAPVSAPLADTTFS